MNSPVISLRFTLRLTLFFGVYVATTRGGVRVIRQKEEVEDRQRQTDDAHGDVAPPPAGKTVIDMAEAVDYEGVGDERELCELTLALSPDSHPPLRAPQCEP